MIGSVFLAKPKYGPRYYFMLIANNAYRYRDSRFVRCHMLQYVHPVSRCINTFNESSDYISEHCVAIR